MEKENKTILNIKLSKKVKKLLMQIFRFGIVGVIATIIDFATIYILKEFLKFNIIVANTLSFCIATIFNYWASITWVFNVNEKNNPKKSFILFLLFSVIGLLLNDVIMYFTTEKFKIYYMLGKIIATCFTMIFNFVTRKLFLE